MTHLDDLASGNLLEPLLSLEGCSSIEVLAVCTHDHPQNSILARKSLGKDKDASQEGHSVGLGKDFRGDAYNLLV